MSNITIEQNNDKFRGVWLPNTFYRQDDMVFDGTSLWVALADFTSGVTFDAVNWFCPSCGGGFNPEQGFDSSTLGSHIFPSGDSAIIRNATGSILSETVYGKVVHPHSDTTLRYFEFEAIETTSASYGFGLSSLSWLGNGPNAVGLYFSEANVYLNGSVIIGPLDFGNNGDYVRVWTRGNRCWLGAYTVSNGYYIAGGGNPYTDTNPTHDFGGLTGDFKPMATCYFNNPVIRINTVGPFTHPPTSPAVPWDS